MDKQILVFNTSFYNRLKILKSFIKNFFLDNHRAMCISIKPDKLPKVCCQINMGRFIVMFIEEVQKAEGFTEETKISLDMESGLKYAEMDADKEKKLRLLYTPSTKKLSAFVSGFALPLKDMSFPDEPPEVYYDIKEFTQENTELFKTMFSLCTQKEDFITIKDNIMYEKLTSNFYHIEKVEFPDTTFAYEDLKMISEMIGDNPCGYASAPSFHVIRTKDTTIFIMRYSLEKIDKEPIYRRTKLTKPEVMNVINVDTREMKNLLNALVVGGNKVFGWGIGKQFCMCGVDMQPYKLHSESQLSIIEQTFFLEKKEISLILKHCNKDNIKILTGKDFAIIGNKFFLKMHTLNKGEEDE